MAPIAEMSYPGILFRRERSPILPSSRRAWSLAKGDFGSGGTNQLGAWNLDVMNFEGFGGSSKSFLYKTAFLPQKVYIRCSLGSRKLWMIAARACRH